MLPNKIQIKFFTQSAVDLKEIIPIFHSWIQDDQLDGLLLDVADYRHVPNGPGILLMGHAGDYALDLAQGRPGISYAHKRDWPETADTLEARIKLVLTKVQAAVSLLETQTPIHFDRSELEIRFLDRLNAPNSADNFSSVQEILEHSNHFGSPIAHVSHVSADQRHALAVGVHLTDELVAT